MPTRTPTIEYPTSDGKPMAETDLHIRIMAEIKEMLREWFKSQHDVYVSGNILVFYEEGNKHRHVSPDILVVHGVPNQERVNYLIWEERPLEFVIELTSKSTKAEDTKTKMALYRDVLAIPEYFLFDPYQEYLKPSFQGYRLVDGEYQAIPMIDGRMTSEVLGLELFRDGNELRFRDPDTGNRLPTQRELFYEEQASADEARTLARNAQAKAREEQAKAREEQAKAENAQMKAHTEQEARIAAEARVAELEAELDRLRKQSKNGSYS
jgi:Uma2 family endonuclease